jgi:hypothetical protein
MHGLAVKVFILSYTLSLSVYAWMDGAHELLHQFNSKWHIDEHHPHYVHHHVEDHHNAFDASKITNAGKQVIFSLSFFLFFHSTDNPVIAKLQYGYSINDLVTPLLTLPFKPGTPPPKSRIKPLF